MLRGSPAAAVICDPHVQAIQPVKGLAEFLIAGFVHELCQGVDPDYLVFYDAARWSFLTAADDQDRLERLVFHELLHLQPKVDQDGLPVLDKDSGRPKLVLVVHDYEFFDAEVRRYGPVVCDVDPVLEAIKVGNAKAVAREKAKRRGRLRVA
jgi:hypothetical protein